MTIDDLRPVQRRKSVLVALYEEIASASDRVILMALFGLLFLIRYRSELLSVGNQTISAPRAAHLIGFVALGVVLKNLGADNVLRRPDYAVLVIAGLALIHPALVLTGLGLWFIGRREGSLRSLGQLCLGFAWIDLWGALVISVIAPWLLPIEAALGFAAASLFGSFTLLGNAIVRANGYSIVVYSQCSSFANTIVACFIWLSLIKIQRAEIQPAHVRVLAVVLGAIILFNTIRLALMARSFDSYVFWHDGPGATMFSTTLLTIVLGVFYFKLHHVRHQTA